MVVHAPAEDGSHDPVEALYRTHGERIWRAVLAYTQDPDMASDAVAEAFAQALVRGSAIRSPAGWVWRTSFRIAAGMLHERSRSVRLAGTDSYEMREPGGQFLKGLASLPAKQGAALILFYSYIGARPLAEGRNAHHRPRRLLRDLPRMAVDQAHDLFRTTSGRGLTSSGPFPQRSTLSMPSPAPGKP